MLSEIFFTVKVISINSVNDYQGNEYIRIEFGYRPPKMPTMVPTSVPKEFSEAFGSKMSMVELMIPPQVRAHMSQPTSRLTLYLTINEWENLQQKHTFGDEFRVILKTDGGIGLTKI